MTDIKIESTDVKKDNVFQISMVCTSMGRFVGKFRENDDIIILNDAIEFVTIMTNQGPVIAGTVLGRVEIDVDDVVVVKLSNKSPYYTQYFQTTSGLVTSINPKLNS